MHRAFQLVFFLLNLLKFYQNNFLSRFFTREKVIFGFIEMIFNIIVVIIYIIILTFGLLGNCWVINSVIRSRRPRNGSLTPSDRLRTYIGLLAVVDLLVILSLIIRTAYVVLPYITISEKFLNKKKI